MKYALWKYPIHFLACGFGAGWSPVVPGTVGTLVGVAIFWLLSGLGAGAYLLVVIGMLVAGVYICAQTARDYGVVDPGFIVYDEIVGFLLAMYLLPKSWGWVIAAFLLFRLFDIWKPFPVDAVDRRFDSGLGIMADDVIAALYVLLILHIARVLLQRVGYLA